ncbi:MAG: hypothetical protein J6M30_07875 [Bacteroidales bacterium]|nr:hypothetical protein [Bacteroidales bacterium]
MKLKAEKTVNAMKDNYHILIIILIAFLSFFFYSYNYYPGINSDDAMNVLMAHYYEFPGNIFCWGQNRGGTLIPLISQIFIHLFGLKAVTSVSIATYLLLLTGVLCLCSLLKTKFLKIILAMVWFFPFQRFVDIVRYPIGMEYCLIAVAVCLINKLWDADKSKLSSRWMMCGVVLSLILAYWVLYNAVFTIVLLILVLMVFNKMKLPGKHVLITFAIGVVLFACAWFYMYSQPYTECKQCNQINTLSEVKDSFLILGKALYNYLFFSEVQVRIAVGVYAWLVVLFLAVVIILAVKTKVYRQFIKDKWAVFFLADFFMFMGVYFLSAWVRLNNMASWYYVSCYISLSMAILLCIDKMQQPYAKVTCRRFLILISLTAAVSTYSTFKYTAPYKTNPMLQRVRQTEQLGKCGVLGDWQYAYLSSIYNPENIIASPHDKCWDYTRNIQLAERAVSQDNIYLIKNNWLKEFPDTITQFDRLLIKSGEPFTLSFCTMCKYRKKQN